MRPPLAIAALRFAQARQEGLASSVFKVKDVEFWSELCAKKLEIGSSAGQYGLQGDDLLGVIRLNLEQVRCDAEHSRQLAVCPFAS
jgi:hypothetical protein